MYNDAYQTELTQYMYQYGDSGDDKDELVGRVARSVYRVFPGGKVRPRRDSDPSPPSSAEVKNGVKLYLYSP
jgi:hypothetical protein